jgi:TonB family protein
MPGKRLQKMLKYIRKLSLWGVAGLAALGLVACSTSIVPEKPTPVQVAAGCVLSPANIETAPHFVKGYALRPVFPIEALRNRISGDVSFVFTINSDGTVSNIKLVNEEPEGYGFASAAQQALEKVLFTPATVNGQPVKVDCWAKSFHFGFGL